MLDRISRLWRPTAGSAIQLDAAVQRADFYLFLWDRHVAHCGECLAHGMHLCPEGDSIYTSGTTARRTASELRSGVDADGLSMQVKLRVGSGNLDSRGAQETQ
jgi:hypothetical protein